MDILNNNQSTTNIYDHRNANNIYRWHRKGCTQEEIKRLIEINARLAEIDKTAERTKTKYTQIKRDLDKIKENNVTIKEYTSTRTRKQFINIDIIIEFIKLQKEKKEILARNKKQCSA